MDNHPRRWIQRWMLVYKIRNIQGVTFYKESRHLIVDGDKMKAHLMVNMHMTILLVYLFIPFLVR
jgi:hypothetical protein